VNYPFDARRRERSGGNFLQDTSGDAEEREKKHESFIIFHGVEEKGWDFARAAPTAILLMPRIKNVSSVSCKRMEGERRRGHVRTGNPA
jgi:hypothetical protein